MTLKRPKPLPLAVALQIASLLVVAGGLFGILIGDIMRHKGEVAKVDGASQVPLIALPHQSDAKSR